MDTAPIAESFGPGSSYTSGLFRIYLKDRVRRRYRRQGAVHDSYEFVIDANRQLKVKLAAEAGYLMSSLERLRYGLFARFAIVTTQPVITSMVPSLIYLDSEHLSNADVWHLLTYKFEWRVESSERFYRHFLRDRATVSAVDVLTTIAGDIRAEYLYYLGTGTVQNGEAPQLAPLSQTMLDEYVIPQVNQRIAGMGVRIQQFYRPAMREPQIGNENETGIEIILTDLINPYHKGSVSPVAAVRSTPVRDAIIAGLHSHLCQKLHPDKQWIEHMLHGFGFDIVFDELQAALTRVTNDPALVRAPLAQLPTTKSGVERRQRAADIVQTPALTPASVVQSIKDAGHAQLRAANRTMPQDSAHRDRLRRKALVFFQLALLLSDSPLLTAGKSANQNMRFALQTLIHSLSESKQKGRAQMAFRLGSTVHLIAVTAQSAGTSSDGAPDDYENLQFVHEILPLVTQPYGGMLHHSVAVWTPAAAAKHAGFTGAAEEIDLTLQVLEPDSLATPNIESGESVLFWTWKVRARREQFSIRLQATSVPTLYDIELQDAEFTDAESSRSSKFPELPHIRLQHEPLELALLIDGYWLASGSPGQPDRRTGLALLVDLLDGLDEIENLTKRGLLLHAVICLDDHISQDFLTAYGSLPCLYALGHAPIETTAQLVAEWLLPWLERWQAWEIKPYPVDTDISLEKGFQYLRQLQWQQTTHPAQRAVLAVGRSRPHDHARYFPDISSQDPLYIAGGLDRLDIPYHPDDRFSVTDIDWREELHSLRKSTGTILALCDPGLPNPHYDLSTSHPLYREYQEFWATVDPMTILDVNDKQLTQHAEMGVDRVLHTLDTQFFQRRAVRCCEPALALPLCPISKT